MITRNGIVYDLELSSYKHNIQYDNDIPLNITFIFSSKLHKDKFVDRLEEHRKTISESLTKRFNYSISFDTLADLVLYRKIETRGFRIVVNDEVVECLNNIILSGEMANKTN